GLAPLFLSLLTRFGPHLLLVNLDLLPGQRWQATGSAAHGGGTVRVLALGQVQPVRAMNPCLELDLMAGQGVNRYAVSQGDVVGNPKGPSFMVLQVAPCHCNGLGVVRTPHPPGGRTTGAAFRGSSRPVITAGGVSVGWHGPAVG